MKSHPKSPADPSSPDTVRLDDQLCFALYAASNAITRAYRPLLGHIGLTYPQYLVMMVIWENGAQTITGLAATLKLPPGAISPIVDQLEKSGLAERHRDQPDRRVVKVSATRRGQSLEAPAARIQKTIVEQTGLGKQEFDDLRVSLHKLTDWISAQPGVSPEDLLSFRRPNSRNTAA